MIPKQIHFLKVIGFLLLLLNSDYSYSQQISVPKTLEVAGIKLRISQQAQRLIEKKVIEMLKQPKQFEQNLYNAQLYLPLIEKILEEEKVPNDYKYLALQLSNLDLKKYNQLHQELGLWQIAQRDMEILELSQNEDFDDRMNVMMSTKAVAKRLYRSNQLHFKNWIINILSLQMGEDKAKKYIRRSLHRSDYLKAQVMGITQNNHDFILTFLAIKVLYDDKVKTKDTFFKTILLRGQKLKKIAKQYRISLSRLLTYNPFIKTEKIKLMEGQELYLIIPQFDSLKLKQEIQEVLVNIEYPKDETIFLPEPVSSTFETNNSAIVNKVETEVTTDEAQTQITFHIVRNGENLYDIARKYKVRVRKLRHYNHINQRINRLYIGQKIYLVAPRKIANNDSGQTYYARFKHHIVSGDQTLYQIAKMYQVRTDEIKEWNNLVSETLHKDQELLIKRKHFVRRLQSPNSIKTRSFSDKMQLNYRKQSLLKNIPKKHDSVEF